MLDGNACTARLTLPESLCCRLWLLLVQVHDALAACAQAEARNGDGDARCGFELRIEFSAPEDTGSAGLRFFDGFAATCQQRNRTRAWLPCVDMLQSRCTWDLQVLRLAAALNAHGSDARTWCAHAAGHATI